MPHPGSSSQSVSTHLPLHVRRDVPDLQLTASGEKTREEEGGGWRQIVNTNTAKRCVKIHVKNCSTWSSWLPKSQQGCRLSALFPTQVTINCCVKDGERNKKRAKINHLQCPNRGSQILFSTSKSPHHTLQPHPQLSRTKQWNQHWTKAEITTHSFYPHF